MNITKKLLVTAGVILQLTTSLCAGYNLENWANAFLAFAGGSDAVAAAQYVIANPNSVSAAGALTAAQPNGVGVNDEQNAVGAFMAQGRKNLFQSVFQASDVQAAARQLISGSRGSNGSSKSAVSSSKSSPSVSAADVEQAQKADALAAAQIDDALALIAKSSAQGAPLYKQYIDVIFDELEQAINAMPSQDDQAAVLAYIKAQVASLRIVPAANLQSSRTLGRMSSKKVAKVAKKNHRK